ncbi:MAG: SH3 domain-containing protein [Gemmobacter sp.]
MTDRMRAGRRWVADAMAAAMFVAMTGGAALAQTGAGDDAGNVTGIAPVAAAGPSSAPGRGAVTNLLLPRYVTLKTGEGNARRGPGLGHRIDWVFTRAGMPLRITAEHDNWRRVEDAEGMGGWVHYSLLSGSRSVIVTEDMAEFRAAPQEGAQVVMQAEAGVIARLVQCRGDWCRVSVAGSRGWLPRRAIWGVDAGETVD